MEHIYYNLKLYSLHGTPSHFYHFFYGVLIPLIKVYDELDKTNKNITFIIRDELGPLIRILFSLPIDIKYKYEIKDVVITDLHLQPMDIHPYDQKRDIKMVNRGYAQYFTYDVKKQVNNWMISCLRNYDLTLKSKKYDIVIIERKQDKKFKSVVHADNQYKEIFKKSGSERRNISNHDELVTMIKNKFPTCSVLSISLENLGLFDQFHLFRTSKIIIAQHGAALANICFMKKKSLCIEIVSDLILGLHENWFGYVSGISQVNHLQFVYHTNAKALDQRDDAQLDITKFKEFLIKNSKIIDSALVKKNIETINI